MDMKKKEYTKPSIRLVEWEFNEAVCQTIYLNSPTKCLNVKTGNSFNNNETRYTSSDDNTWTQSRW